MIIIPTGTDAPIYHWPYATVGLILLNIAMFLAVPPKATELDLDENGNVIEDVHKISNFERFALTLGDGRLHPIQWVTHNFLHYDTLHLAGNLLFLWSFGIVVEGKLGASKFLTTYVTIGTMHGALVQSLLMKSGLDGHAAGASAVIYGLLAICMIWAPRNELSCTVILIVGFRVLVYQWEPYYTTVALLYIGAQLFGLAFWGSIEGRIMVSEMGHLSGAFWGAVMAVLLLKARQVDCEGWDLFSVWARWNSLGHAWKSRGERLDRQQESLRRSTRRLVRDHSASTDDSADTGVAMSQKERGAMALRRIISLIDEGAIEAALKAYDQAARSFFNWPSRPDLLAMIKALDVQGAESQSLRLMRDHCRLYPGDSNRVRIRLAQVLIRDHQRPLAALQVLEEISSDPIPHDLDLVRRKLVAKANRLIEDGVLELEGGD